MKGSASGVSRNNLLLLLLAVAAARSAALPAALCVRVDTQRAQVQRAKVKCSSCCTVVPQTVVGAEPKVSCTAQADPYW